jgi:squalene synthase HpnC
VVRIAEAYAACERLAAAHYENFPVASRLLPREMRPHVAAIYAFARVADDFADEGQRPESERHRLLDDWLARLRACAVPVASPPAPASHAPGRDLDAGHRPDTRPRDDHAPPAPGLETISADPDVDPDRVFMALGETIRVCRLPVTLFEDLISAFRQDITTHRYDTWDQVLDYCRRSANPVGRLVLRVAGYDDPFLDTESDAVCTALQLTNFWQDLDRDYQRGRLYVPRVDLEASGAAELDLTTRSLTPAWVHLMRDLAARTRALFERGQPVCDAVSGRLRHQLRFTWLGGCRILERLEESGFDVFNHRPALGASDLPVLLWRAARWRRRPAS